MNNYYYICNADTKYLSIANRNRRCSAYIRAMRVLVFCKTSKEHRFFCIYRPN